LESDDESSDEEEDEDGDNDSKIKEDIEDFILDQNVLKWISYLWNAQDTKALYTKIMNIKSSSNQNGDLISPEVVSFCKLYLSFILKIPAYSNEILSILLYTKNIDLLSTLWDFTNSSALANEIINQTSITRLISSNIIWIYQLLIFIIIIYL